MYHLGLFNRQNKSSWQFKNDQNQPYPYRDRAASDCDRTMPYCTAPCRNSTAPYRFQNSLLCRMQQLRYGWKRTGSIEHGQVPIGRVWLADVKRQLDRLDFAKRVVLLDKIRTPSSPVPFTVAFARRDQAVDAAAPLRSLKSKLSPINPFLGITVLTRRSLPISLT